MAYVLPLTFDMVNIDMAGKWMEIPPKYDHRRVLIHPHMSLKAFNSTVLCDFTDFTIYIHGM